MYVAVKGGERAIENAHRLLAHERRGDRDVPEISLGQIAKQLSLGVDRVMTEGSLYDRELAALAIKQARGDMIEAIFLVRAFRATLPRFGENYAAIGSWIASGKPCGLSVREDLSPITKNTSRFLPHAIVG